MKTTNSYETTLKIIGFITIGLGVSGSILLGILSSDGTFAIIGFFASIATGIIYLGIAEIIRLQELLIEIVKRSTRQSSRNSTNSNYKPNSNVKLNSPLIPVMPDALTSMHPEEDTMGNDKE